MTTDAKVRLTVPANPSPELAELLINNTPENVYYFAKQKVEYFTMQYTYQSEPWASIMRELLYGKQC